MNSNRHLPPLAAAAIAAACCGNGHCDVTNQAALFFDSPSVLAVVFHPRQEDPRDAGAGGFENLTVPVASGVVLGGRFYPAGTNRPTILFFHGNGEIAADYSGLAPVYIRAGINFMPLDYRGYGRSTGRPSVTTMLADAHVAFAFARKWLADHGYAGRLVVMGRSLGSASALELASAHADKIDGLIIESGFSDAPALVQRLGWRPATGMPADTLFRHGEKIGRYQGPTLIIHGTLDTIIPIADAEALYQASGSTGKKFLRIDGAGHNNLLAMGFDRYFQAVSDIVRNGTPAD